MSGYGFSIPGSGYDAEDRLVTYNRTDGNLDQSWNLSLVGDWNSVTTEGTVQSRTHGATHELLTGAGQNVTTDVKGNITTIPGALRHDGKSLDLYWDFDNQLRLTVDSSGFEVMFTYDALGRRIVLEETATVTDFAVYVPLGQQTIAEYRNGAAPDNPRIHYVYASYVDEPVLRYEHASSESLYYHRNQQYSITALTDALGTIVERYAYSAYGVPTITNASGTVLSSSAYNNRYLYTGREWVKYNHLYHYRARFYDPELGRFISGDPIGYAGGFNMFSYVHSGPLRFLDPFGLKCVNYIFLGHHGNVMANIEKDDRLNPGACDKVGVVCCFMDDTMEECRKTFGDEHVIPDWPKRNDLIDRDDFQQIFHDLETPNGESLKDSCEDCECKRASVVHICDNDFARDMDILVQNEDIQRNWCDWIIDMDCETGELTYRHRRRPRRMPLQPVTF